MHAAIERFTATDAAFSEGWERLDMAKLRSKQAAGGLLERIKAMKPGCPTWLDKLTDEQRQEVFELRRGWRAGEVKVGPMRVHQDLLEYIGSEVVSETTLRRFLGKKPQKESA